MLQHFVAGSHPMDGSPCRVAILSNRGARCFEYRRLLWRGTRNAQQGVYEGSRVWNTRIVVSVPFRSISHHGTGFIRPQSRQRYWEYLDTAVFLFSFFFSSISRLSHHYHDLSYTFIQKFTVHYATRLLACLSSCIAQGDREGVRHQLCYWWESYPVWNNCLGYSSWPPGHEWPPTDLDLLQISPTWRYRMALQLNHGNKTVGQTRPIHPSPATVPSSPTAPAMFVLHKVSPTSIQPLPSALNMTSMSKFGTTTIMTWAQ